MLHPPLNLWSCGQREEAAAHNSTGQIKIKQSIGVFSKPLEIQMRLNSGVGEKPSSADASKAIATWQQSRAA